MTTITNQPTTLEKIDINAEAGILGNPDPDHRKRDEITKAEIYGSQIGQSFLIANPLKVSLSCTVL